MISKTESSFILEGIQFDTRLDGRRRFDYRSVDVKLGIVPSANGSSRVTLGKGTQVLCVAKLSIGHENIMESGEEASTIAAAEDYQDDIALLDTVAGRIRCHVDGADLDGRRWEDVKTEYTAMMDQILNQQDVIDIKRLSIVTGKLCWNIDLDITVLKNAGNLIDSIFMAARAALYDLRIPNLKTENLGSDMLEYDIDEDHLEDVRIIIEDVPLCINLLKIGDCHFVVDPTLIEEEFSDAHITVAVDKRGRIVGVRKGNGAGVPAAMFIDMIQTARQVGQMILTQQDNFFAQQTNE